MEVAKEWVAAKKISWGSVIGGVITVLAVSLLLSTLGTSLGFSIVDPTSDDPINGAGTTVVIWSAVSIIISLAAGAFIAGRLAANDGLIHGFLVWATSLIVAAVLGGMLVGSAVKATGNALGAIASTSGSLLSGAGSAIGKGHPDWRTPAVKCLTSWALTQPWNLNSCKAMWLRRSKKRYPVIAA